MAAKSKPASKKIMSTGVGESKRFYDPEAKQEYDWSKLTVNGHAIDEELHGILPYHLTDQAAEQRLADQFASGVPTSTVKVEITRDADDKQIDKMAGGLKGEHGLVTDDPFKHLMDKHTPKGHRGLFMGKKKTDESGMVRGQIPYEKVLVDGKEVTIGKMFLASAPIETVEAAMAKYNEINRNKQISVVNQVKENQDKMLGDAGESRMQRLARKRGVTAEMDGIHTEDDETAAPEILEHFTT